MIGKERKFLGDFDHVPSETAASAAVKYTGKLRGMPPSEIFDKLDEKVEKGELEPEAAANVVNELGLLDIE